MDQLLAVSGEPQLTEIEPSIFELRVKLEDSSYAIIKMNIFQIQRLGALIEPHMQS